MNKSIDTSQSQVIRADFVKWLRGNQWQAQNGYIEKYHAVLADPPYGIDFMSKGWDAYTPQNYQAWVTEWARMLLDFVHPGGVLMMFGGTRTYHRLVAGLEDAGWEIYDSVMVWMYGSGFPKSHDISKGIDKAAGAEREVVARQIATGTARGKGAAGHYANQLSLGDYEIVKDGWDITKPTTDEAEQWEGYGTALKPSYEPIVLARKPRAGLTYAECALQFGSGALNIDGSRIGTEEINRSEPYLYVGNAGNSMGKHSLHLRVNGGGTTSNLGRWPANTILIHHPDCNGACMEACHVRVLGEQSGESVSNDTPRHNGEFKSHSKGHEQAHTTHGHNDAGSAARFFYQAKAAGWERDAGLGSEPQPVASMQGNLVNGQRLSGKGEPIKTPLRKNIHPTIKPIQLAEYLATLLLPPIDNARLLVPFAGSGSEMIGAMLAGWNSITGIEMTDEYIPIAEARLKWWSGFDTYDDAKESATSAKRGQAKEDKVKTAGQMSLFDLLPELEG